MELDNTVKDKVISNSKDMNGWIKFLGIAYIVSGGLTIIFSFGFGIIIAWLPIWLGVIILKVSSSSREVAGGQVESLGKMFDSLKTFFILSGVLTILSIVLSILWFVIVGIAMIGGILGEAGGFY